MTRRSRWVKVSLGGAVVGMVLLPVAALGSRIGLWPFTVGFLLLLLGVLLAALALGAGMLGIIIAVRQGRREVVAALAGGVVLSLLIVGGFAVLLGSARAVPAIHNISTDISDPPEFDVVVGLREGANPHRYDASQDVGDRTLGDIQQSAYPEVRSLITTLGVSDGLDRAVETLEEMGLEIVNVDPDRGIVEATATTFWFGFKDDVVVRVRPREGGAVVDVHSVSRVGQSDLGANANRIVEFLRRFSAS